MPKGDVKCKICGRYLGNYLNDDYYKLIRMKYCPDCRAEVRREYKRVWEHDKRHHERLVRQAEKDQLLLLWKENEILRERLKDERQSVRKIRG